MKAILFFYGFFFGAISKDRDAQILDAENALGRGDIDELQFLDRIIYKNGPKDPQSYFTNLSEADDYFAEYEDEDSDDNSNDHIDTLLNVSIPKMPVDPNDARLCKVIDLIYFDVENHWNVEKKWESINSIRIRYATTVIQIVCCCLAGIFAVA